jgi:hypothetical protein
MLLPTPSEAGSEMNRLLKSYRLSKIPCADHRKDRNDEAYIDSTVLTGHLRGERKALNLLKRLRDNEQFDL